MCERLIEGRRQINVFNYDWKYFYTISFITALCILCFIASFRADIIGADHINYIYAVSYTHLTLPTKLEV